MLTSWWIDPEPVKREGFTAYASKVLNAPIKVDDISDREMQAMVRRADLLAALIGVRTATASRVTRAIELSRN